MGPVLVLFMVLLPHQCKLSLFIRKIVYAQNARELIKYKKLICSDIAWPVFQHIGTRRGGMLIDRIM
jgi:hypothetical protein